MTVAAAVLAAGRGSRYGGSTPKPVALLQGRPLVAWSVDAMVASGLEPTLLVVGPDAEQVVAAAMAPEVRAVVAERADEGIAHSLHAALDALEAQREVTAVCIGLADQPRIGADAYRRLAAAHEAGAELAAATYAGERGNPVLLGRSLWAAARELHGDVGARALMTGRDVAAVDCTDTGDPRDVDTLEDLRAIEQEMG